MQYHKIPQNVTGYQGHIIGKFTAHQFIYLAVGGIIIFLVFTAPALPRQYKVIFIAATGLLTALFSLVNYEGRSTDAWILTFIRAVATPTQRIWLKKGRILAYLLPGTGTKHLPATTVTKPHGEAIYAALKKEDQTKKGDLTEEETAFLERLEGLKSS